MRLAFSRKKPEDVQSSGANISIKFDAIGAKTLIWRTIQQRLLKKANFRSGWQLWNTNWTTSEDDIETLEKFNILGLI